MFIERRLNSASNIVELWVCEWENSIGGAARKAYLSKIGEG